jgi:hypothetical protein
VPLEPARVKHARFAAEGLNQRADTDSMTVPWQVGYTPHLPLTREKTTRAYILYSIFRCSGSLREPPGYAAYWPPRPASQHPYCRPLHGLRLSKCSYQTVSRSAPRSRRCASTVK